jgi:hypothetical protein
MKKLVRIAIITFFSLFFSSNYVLAVPMAPSPNCEIIADVLDVVKTNARPTIFEPERNYEYYVVNLKINKISLNSEGGKNCTDLYPVGSIKKTDYSKDDYNKIPLSHGQKISGNIWLGGDERNSGLYLKKVSLLSGDENKTKMLEPTKVSQKLIDNKVIDKVNKIEPSADQQTFQIEGQKKVKLFAFIPVRLNIKITTDADGNVIKVQKPWWSFLTK